MSNFLLISKIMLNVLIKRGFVNFFYEIVDLIIIDLKFKTKTFKRVNNKKDNYVPYYSLPLKKNLKRLEEQIDFKKTYFIDIGSGKGRILLSASSFKFLKIIGIEKNKLLFKECYKNIKKNNLQKQIKLINKDFFKTSIKFQKNTNLIFFWYRTSNKSSLIKFLKKINKNIFKQKVFFYIVPQNDVPKNLHFIEKITKNKDFKNDKTRRSTIIKFKED